MTRRRTTCRSCSRSCSTWTRRGTARTGPWFGEHIGDKPYGVDIVIPGKYEGMGEIDPVKLEQQQLAAIPEQHRQFADKILAEHGVPKLPEGERPIGQLLGWTAATATPQVAVALKHEKVKLIANALGTPPQEVIDEIHATGRRVAALCGSAKHALSSRPASTSSSRRAPRHKGVVVSKSASRERAARSGS